MWSFMVPLLAAEAVAPVHAAAAAGGDELFGLSRAVFTIVCLGAVLIVLAAIFMVRRFLNMLMNVVFLLLGTALVIVALFGHQLGIFDAIAELAAAGRETPGHK